MVSGRYRPVAAGLAFGLVVPFRFVALSRLEGLARSQAKSFAINLAKQVCFSEAGFSLLCRTKRISSRPKFFP